MVSVTENLRLSLRARSSTLGIPKSTLLVDMKVRFVTKEYVSYPSSSTKFHHAIQPESGVIHASPHLCISKINLAPLQGVQNKPGLNSVKGLLMAHKNETQRLILLLGLLYDLPHSAFKTVGWQFLRRHLCTFLKNKRVKKTGIQLINSR